MSCPTCVFVSDYSTMLETCDVCGDERPIRYSSFSRRSLPTINDQQPQWMSHVGGNERLNHSNRTNNINRLLRVGTKLRLEVESCIDRYSRNSLATNAILGVWSAFIGTVSHQIRGQRRLACLVTIILSMIAGKRFGSVPDGLLSNVRYCVSGTNLFAAFRFIERELLNNGDGGDRGGDRRELGSLLDDVRLVRLESLDWSHLFPDEWSRAVVVFKNINRLSLRFFHVGDDWTSDRTNDGERYHLTGRRWSRVGDKVLMAISVLVVYSLDHWKPGLAHGGKYLRTITKQLCQLKFAPRTIRSPLKQLWDYRELIVDTDMCTDILRRYRQQQNLVAELNIAPRQRNIEIVLTKSIPKPSNT